MEYALETILFELGELRYRCGPSAVMLEDALDVCLAHFVHPRERKDARLSIKAGAGTVSWPIRNVLE